MELSVLWGSSWLSIYIFFFTKVWQEIFGYTVQEGAWRSLPSGCRAVCGPHRWFCPLPESKKTSWLLGWGDCAIVHGTASRSFPGGAWQWLTNAWGRTFAPSRWPVRTSGNHCYHFKRRGEKAANIFYECFHLKCQKMRDVISEGSVFLWRCQVVEGLRLHAWLSKVIMIHLRSAL